MASKTIVTLIDDLEAGETPADETVDFGLDGRVYEIDLCERNATNLRRSMDRFVALARRTGRLGAVRSVNGHRALTTNRRPKVAALAPEPAPAPEPVPDPVSPPVSTVERNKAIKAWARKHRIFVAARGRVSALVQEAFDADDPKIYRRAMREK